MLHSAAPETQHLQPSQKFSRLPQLLFQVIQREVQL